MRVLALLACVLLAGCAGKTLRLESVAGRGTLVTEFPTRVFRSSDANTVDVYFTDLPPELWRADADLSGASGTLVHLHMFLSPKAGKTPMASTASNLTIRYLICARGALGLYAGGGFILNQTGTAEREFEARVSRGSVRLIRKSTSFRDALGPAELSGKIEATNDPPSAAVLAERMRQLVDALPEVSEPQAK